MGPKGTRTVIIRGQAGLFSRAMKNKFSHVGFLLLLQWIANESLWAGSNVMPKIICAPHLHLDHELPVLASCPAYLRISVCFCKERVQLLAKHHYDKILLVREKHCEDVSVLGGMVLQKMEQKSWWNTHTHGLLCWIYLGIKLYQSAPTKSIFFSWVKSNTENTWQLWESVYITDSDWFF